MKILLTITLLLCASLCSAQAVKFDTLTPPLQSMSARHAADVVSYGTWGTSLLLDSRASWQSERRTRAFMLQGVRMGVTYGATAVVKKLIHRDRPCAPSCGVDLVDASFWSGHTVGSFQAIGGPRLSLSLPLAISTGGLRIAAGKHYLTDVLAAAGVGLLTSRIR